MCSSQVKTGISLNQYSFPVTISNRKKGFAIVYIDRNGRDCVHPVEARDSRFFFGGKLY